MNKKIGKLLLAAIAASSLAACGSEDKGEVTISKVELKGIRSSYTPSETIDWQTASVVISYSDNTATSISVDKIEFDVESKTADTTLAIVNTSGLHAMSELEEGDYEISAKLSVDNFEKTHSLGKIKVVEFDSSKYRLTAFMKPEFLVEYEENVQAAKNSKFEDEGAFMKADDIFTVGNKNVFKFQPSAQFLPIGGTKPIITNGYRKTVTVKQDSEGILSDANLSDYTVVSEGIKFNDSAVGKKFKISVLPTDFEKMFPDGDIKPVEMTVQVENGMNIYNAQQLAAVNFTSVSAEENFVGSKSFYWSRRLGEKDGQVQANKVRVSYPGTGSTYVVRDSIAIWKDFLINNGTFTESEVEEISKYKEMMDPNDSSKVKSPLGFFFMNSMTLEDKDLPKDFFIEDGESANVDNTATGCLRDGLNLYLMTTNIERVINGNYFSFDASKVSICKSEAGESGSLKVFTKDDTYIAPGHSALFCFYGQEVNDSTENTNYKKGQEYNSNIKSSLMKNIHSKGNTTKDLNGGGDSEDEQFEKMAKVTGLIFTIGRMSPCYYDNIIAQEYMIAFDADPNIGSGYNDKNPKDTFIVDDCKVFDCASSGVFSYEAGGVRVKHSVLKRFGGSAVMNVGSVNEEYCAGVINVNSDCVVENYITGNEVYFAALDASSKIAVLKGLNYFTSNCGFEFNSDAGIMNVLGLTLDGGYLSSKDRTCYGQIVFDADTAPFGLSSKDTTMGSSGFTYGAFQQTAGMYAPVARTNEGDHSTIIIPQAVPEFGIEAPGAAVYLTGGNPPIAVEDGTPLTGKYLSLFAPVPAATGDGTTLNIVFGR